MDRGDIRVHRRVPLRLDGRRGGRTGGGSGLRRLGLTADFPTLQAVPDQKLALRPDRGPEPSNRAWQAQIRLHRRWHDLTARGVGLKVLTGQGAAIDTTTPAGKLVFGIFAALAEFERELISERTQAGLASARARGRKGGRPYKMTPAKLRLATASMGQPDAKIGELCVELGITRQTLYRHVSPTGQLRPDGLKLLADSQRRPR